MRRRVVRSHGDWILERQNRKPLRQISVLFYYTCIEEFDGKIGNQRVSALLGIRYGSHHGKLDHGAF